MLLKMKLTKCLDRSDDVIQLRKAQEYNLPPGGGLQPNTGGTPSLREKIVRIDTSGTRTVR